MGSAGYNINLLSQNILREFLVLGLLAGYSFGAPSTVTEKNRGVRVELADVRLRFSDSKSEVELVTEALKEDEARLKWIEKVMLEEKTAGSTREDLRAGLSIGTTNYIAQIGFGSPLGRRLSLVMDTGSDITWIQCLPCLDCHSQAEALFDPAESKTYSPLPCDSAPCAHLQGFHFRPSPDCANCTYYVHYNDRSATEGDFVEDTLTVGSDSVSSFAFGCAHRSTGGLVGGAAGLLGLGQSPLSFPSQTADIYGQVFSYCLPTFGVGGGSNMGSLYFGEGAIPAVGAVFFVPLVINAENPFHYYTRLTGLAVGGAALDISPRVFDFKAGGDGGVIIDSGTLVTRLVEPVYTVFRNAFRNRTAHIPSATGESIFDTCYTVDSGRAESVGIPTVAFVFENGVEVILPPKNVLIRMYDQGTTMCLAFAPTSDVISKDLSIIGSFQQQDLRVIYDARNSRLGFAAQQCDA